MAKNDENRNKQKLENFTNEVQKFITKNNMADLHDNLILDYLECFYDNGVDLSKLDVEQTVYTFYGYVSKHEKLIDESGENKFIKLIVSEEIAKMVKAEEEAKKKKKE